MRNRSSASDFAYRYTHFFLAWFVVCRHVCRLSHSYFVPKTTGWILMPFGK